MCFCKRHLALTIQGTCCKDKFQGHVSLNVEACRKSQSKLIRHTTEGQHAFLNMYVTICNRISYRPGSSTFNGKGSLDVQGIFESAVIDRERSRLSNSSQIILYEVQSMWQFAIEYPRSDSQDPGRHRSTERDVLTFKEYLNQPSSTKNARDLVIQAKLCFIEFNACDNLQSNILDLIHKTPVVTVQWKGRS